MEMPKLSCTYCTCKVEKRFPRSINQSIDRSIKQKAPSHSINQSIHNLLLILMDGTNQAINQSTYQSCDILKYTQSINQSTDYPFEISFVNSDVRNWSAPPRCSKRQTIAAEKCPYYQWPFAEMCWVELAIASSLPCGLKFSPALAVDWWGRHSWKK